MDVREKLVEQAISHFWYGVSHDIFSEPVKTYAKLAIEALEKENGVTVQEWISVEDRLPENGVHVLLCCEMHRYGSEVAGKYVCDGYYAEANKIIAGGFPDECNCEYSEEDDEYYLCEGW